MMNILKKIDKITRMVNDMLAETPTDSTLKVMLLSLEELKREIARPDINSDKIQQLHYGVLRVFDEMREFENTTFGKEMKELLVELNKY